MLCKVLIVVLSTAVIAVKCDWGKICRDHPYLYTAGTGKVMDFDTKNLTKRIGCSLEFDYDYGEEYTAKFCQAMFHDSHTPGEHIHDKTKKSITCEYERFHYCADNDDIMINGKCWSLRKTAENFADADQECKKSGFELPKEDDLLTVEWLIKIYDPNVVLHGSWRIRQRLHGSRNFDGSRIRERGICSERRQQHWSG